MSNPKLYIGNGEIVGRICYSRNGVRFFSFQGIPYAKPPLGKLRFKAPVPASPWDDILDATKDPPQCYQRHIFRYEEVGGQEDCLYLNVYTPNISISHGPYPVMVWIHGGAFVSGSSKTELCGPEFLMSQHIVLVTFNYRVGMLGFMSLNDEGVNVPGNAGLRDQVMALQWIQKNIREFRGNRRNVTLFGQSSGAASVHLHMLSEMSKGLFHKVILQSGCALNPWVNGVFGSGRLLANALDLHGCDERILHLMAKLPVEEIFQAQEKLTNANMVNNKWFCSPVIEKQKKSLAFIADEPINIIRSGNYRKVPMIIGYTSLEGMYWDIYNRTITGKPELITDFKTVIPNNLNAQEDSLLSQTIAKHIEAFYWGPRLQQTRMGRQPRLRNMLPLYDLLTDVFFLRGIHTTVKNHYEISPNTPIYYYRFSIDTQLNVFKAMLPPALQRKYPGATHGDDINYLFSTYLTPEIRFGDLGEITINRMIKMWTTFASTGCPTSTGFGNAFEWKPIFKNCFQFLEIGKKLENKAFADIDRMKFWDVIYQNDVRTKYL